MKLTTIGIIGPNTSLCLPELYAWGVAMGRRLATQNRTFVCGGMGGWMEAVCKGVKSSAETWHGQTVGILPGDTAEQANPYIDLAIPTGIGVARNIVIVNTADVLIAAGGGAGTLSEIAFAWQKGKTVLCLTQFGGWAAELASKDLDARQTGLLVGVETIDAVEQYLHHQFPAHP